MTDEERQINIEGELRFTSKALVEALRIGGEHLYYRQLEDGRVIRVGPLTFGRARLTISERLTACGYLDGW